MFSNIFNEFQEHLIKDKKPSVYFFKKLEEGFFDELYPFTMLGKLVKTNQEPKHHPEGNVFIHTMMVVDEAASRRDQSEDKRAFMWAALLHDLGKAPTTKIRNGRLTSYDHDKVGAQLAKDFLRELTLDEDLILKVSKLIRWHMQILFVVKDMPYKDIENMTKDVSVDEIALLGYCDRLGRGHLDQEKIEIEKSNIDIFLRKSKNAKVHSV